MKFTHIAGLAFVPLVFAGPFGKREERTVNVDSVEDVLEFEVDFAGLIHQLAINADATMAVNAEQRRIRAPVSLNNLVDHVFAENIFSVASMEILRDEYVIQKEKSLLEEEEQKIVTEEQEETTISKEEQAMLNNLRDELMNGLSTLVNDSMTKIQNAVVEMVDRAQIPNIFKFAQTLRNIYEILFKNYGTKTSPIERILHLLEVASKNFGEELQVLEMDSQALVQREKTALLASLRTEIRPLVVDYFVLTSQENLDAIVVAEHVIETTVNDVINQVQSVLDAMEHVVSNIVMGKIDAGTVMSDAIHMRLIKTLGDVTVSFFDLIKEHIQVTNFMIHVLTCTADTYTLFDAHMDQLQKTGNRRINDGLYVLMNDGAQIKKLTNALIRNTKPLTANAASAIHTFITKQLTTINQQEELSRALVLSPLNVIFLLLDKLVEGLQEKNRFIGTFLKKVLVFIETVYKDDPEILTRKLSLGNTVSVVETILDAFIEALKAKILLFEN
ncbi:hypothetical protein BDA99DRAFT_596822 [Phascolomyces articulosus]|uniref:Uncharacterized protein n=1 Tax=Phascolomyces articulosus TaxID=60185 RepID=A0AAD5KEN6_9FUNG|nr:hypothetical protein BDA99DRAFT_596822 [Phascolomyces articulosus]